MQLLTRVRTFLSWHRRPVAAVLAALAMAGLWSAARTPPPPGTEVLVVADPIDAGSTVTGAQLTTARAPDGLLPDGALLPGSLPEHATAAIDLEPGIVVTQALLRRSGSVREGFRLVPIQVPDPALRSLLRPGDVVSLVIAMGERPEELSTARVVEHPDEGAGMFSTDGGRSVVLVEVAAERAAEVAVLGQSGQLSVLLGAD